MNYNAIDLFSGCGGLSEGMRQAGFNILLAIDINKDSLATYKINHPNTIVIQNDIRKVAIEEVKQLIGNTELHLLAGCPPCQGFSSIRRLNRRKSIRDDRNRLILEYLRFVEYLNPLTIMLENVPGIANYYLFNQMLIKLRNLGYYVEFGIVDIKNYGVPQRRKRLVLVGSLLGEIGFVKPNGIKTTVRDAIGNIETKLNPDDRVHKIMAKHSHRITEMIAKIPKDGGNRRDLPLDYELRCHRKINVGFNDVYGRLRWDDYSSTITGGCLNPSKGRFIHPEENRGITAREALLLQSFPPDYKIPVNISKDSISNMIGEALPPLFSYIQSKNIAEHLTLHYGR